MAKFATLWMVLCVPVLVAVRVTVDNTRSNDEPDCSACGHMELCEVSDLNELATGCPLPSCKGNEAECPRECWPVKVSMESKEVSARALGAGIQQCHVTAIYLMWPKNKNAFEHHSGQFFNALVGSKVTSLHMAFFTLRSLGQLGNVMDETPIKELILRGAKSLDRSAFFNIFPKLPASQVEHLDISYNDDGDYTMDILVPHLKMAKKITTLRLDHIELKDTGFHTLSEALPHTNITKLEVRYTKLTDMGAQSLAKGLKDSQVTDLAISENEGLGDGVVSILEALPSSNVSKFDMRRVYKWGTDAKAIVEPLSRILLSSKLTDFTASDNFLCDWQSDECDNLAPLMQALPKSHLKKLNLRRCGLKTLDPQYLADLLSVPDLNLAETAFNGEMEGAFARELPKSSVTSLRLSNTGWKYSLTNFKQFVKALPETRLVSLQLSHLDLGEDLDENFAEILPKCPTLKALDLTKTGIYGMKIFDALRFTNLTSLTLDWNERVEWSVEQLADVLPETKLKSLSLARCGKWKRRHAVKLYHAIVNSTLRDLNIEYNGMGKYDQIYLTEEPVYNKLGEKLRLKYTV